MSEVSAILPRTLLLTSSPPGSQSVGEIFLRDLLEEFPPGAVCCYVVPTPGVTMSRRWELQSAESSVPMIVRPWWQHRGGNDWLRRLRRLVEVNLEFTRLLVRDRRRFLEEATRFGRAFNVSTVWAVLASPVMYVLAHELARRLGVPLVSTVWDPPARIARDFPLLGPLKRIATRHFASSMRASERCAVMSESMAEEYRRKYEVECSIVRHGVDSSLVRHGIAEVREERIRIGYAGSLYAVDEWAALLSALDSVSWRIGDRDVEIVVWGARVDSWMRPGRHLESMGWQAVPDVIQGLSTCSFCYLPYWFAPEYADDVRLCFPTKMTTYLAATRPVLYHGPVVSSPVRFFEQYPVGMSCHSTAPRDIVVAIGSMVGSAERYRAMVVAAREVATGELGAATFGRRFRETMIGLHRPDATLSVDASPSPGV